MQRDWRVDTLRGYFLVAMTLGHFPNPLARYTEYTFGYASAPDGFVFLSGLVSAWVYLRVGQRRGNGAMVSKSLRRAGTIYFTHIALLLFGIMVALVPGLGMHRTSHPVHTFVSGALLWNQVGFDRILPMYCVFMAVSPFVLQQFNKGRAWLVALASACLWIAAQFGLGDSRIDASSLDPVTFNLFAWQAYFIAGQYFGYRGVQSALPSEVRAEVRSEIHTEARMRASGMVRSKALLIACALLAIPLMLDRHLLQVSGTNPIFGFSGHPDHNPVRFLDAIFLGYLFWWIPRTIDAVAMKLVFFRFLNLLGRHSLQVFAYSMIFTRFEARTIKALPPTVQLLIALITASSLALPAWLHQVYRERSAKLQRETALLGAVTRPAATLVL